MAKKPPNSLDKPIEFRPTGSKKRRPLLMVEANPKDIDAANVMTFRPRTFEEIREQIIASLQAQIPNVATTPGSSMGALINVQAEQFAQLEESIVLAMRSMMAEMAPPYMVKVDGEVTPKMMERLEAVTRSGVKTIVTDASKSVTISGLHKDATGRVVTLKDATGRVVTLTPSKITMAFLNGEAMSVRGVQACEIVEPRPGLVTFIITVALGFDRDKVIDKVAQRLEPQRGVGIEFNVIESGSAP